MRKLVSAIRYKKESRSTCKISLQSNLWQAHTPCSKTCQPFLACFYLHCVLSIRPLAAFFCQRTPTLAHSIRSLTLVRVRVRSRFKSQSQSQPTTPPGTRLVVGMKI